MADRHFALKINYQIEWKETLNGFCGDHRFSVEITMGGAKLHVYFPDEKTWEAGAPEWGKGLWESAKDQAIEWSAEKDIVFEISPSSWVFFEK